MNTGAKREIYRQYVALLRAREGIGTVADLAQKHGVTRQRMHQIVREVEDALAQTTRQRDERRHVKEEEKSYGKEISKK